MTPPRGPGDAQALTRPQQQTTLRRIAAERKCGEMLKETARNGERATRGSNTETLRNSRTSRDTTSEPTLSDIGISHDQSSRFQKLAAMPEEYFGVAAIIGSGSQQPFLFSRVLFLAGLRGLIRGFFGFGFR